MLAVETQIASTSSDLPSTVQLQQWAEAALQTSSSTAGEQTLVVRIVDKSESQQLNRDYRDKDKPTNILSFPFEEPQGVTINHLGDLVACAPVITQEAVDQNKSLENHWAHMIVHGVLHLQGFDHQNEAQATEMESLERQILADLGYPDPYAITQDEVTEN